MRSLFLWLSEKILTSPATTNTGDAYYDLFDDWELIAASFMAQYGIRLSKQLSDMSWTEFAAYINGLGPDTPLGRIVAIRAENDPEILRTFTPDQKRIRAEYAKKAAARKSKSEVNNALEMFKQAFVKMAGGTHEEA